MAVVLGIDPGLNQVGYGIIFYDECLNLITDVKYGIYDIDKRQTPEVRMNKTFQTTQDLIYKHKPTEVAIEKAFHNPKRAWGGFVVREVIGVLKVAVVQTATPMYLYTTQETKKAVTGKGNAGKIDVAIEISETLGIEKYIIDKRFRGNMKRFCYTPEEVVKKRLDHVTDALAISYCRLMELKGEQMEGGESINV